MRLAEKNINDSEVKFRVVFVLHIKERTPDGAPTVFCYINQADSNYLLCPIFPRLRIENCALCIVLLKKRDALFVEFYLAYSCVSARVIEGVIGKSTAVAVKM